MADIEIVRLTAEDATKTAFDSVNRSIGQLESNAARLRGVFSNLGVGLSVGVLVGAFTKFSAEAEKSEQSLRALQATLKATGYAAGLTVKQLEATIQGFARVTLFDDDQIRDGVTSLLRFRDISKDVFKNATTAALDFAAATGRDVAGAAQAIGRALQDPVGGGRALREVGIQLSDSQLELARSFLEAGERAKAQRIVLDELAKTVGGAAGAQNVGLTGATRSLTKSWEDLQKAVGKTLNTQPMVGAVDMVTKAVDGLTQAVEALRGSNLTGVLGAPGGALASVGSRLALPGNEGKGRSATGIVRGGPRDEEMQAAIGALQNTIDLAQRNADSKKKKAQSKKGSSEDRDAIEAVREIGRQTAIAAKERQELAEAYNSLDLSVQAQREAKALKEVAESAETLQRILGETQSGQLKELADQERVLGEALGAGKINAQQFDEALTLLAKKKTDVLGFKDAFGSIAKDGENELKRLQFAVEGWGRQFTDTLADAVMTGKLNFSDLAQSIIRDLLRMTIQAQITIPLFKAIGGATGLFAKGGAFGPSGQLTAFASGGVVNRPTLFEFAGGTGLMGEAGPEAIMPLKRTASGRLGVEASGRGGGITIINQIDSRTDRAEVEALARKGTEAALARDRENRRRGRL